MGGIWFHLEQADWLIKYILNKEGGIDAQEKENRKRDAKNHLTMAKDMRLNARKV